MYHITIRPDTFLVNERVVNQNPYIPSDYKKVNHKLALEQHKYAVDQLGRNVNYVLEKTKDFIPDIVFVANGGLSLPRLPESVVILPWMKFEQRRNELKYLKEIYDDLHIKTIEFPGNLHAPFEGAAEAKWFNNGELLIMAYGHRSTKETVKHMRTLLNNIYTSYGLEPPRVISFPLQSPEYYHLDIAMLEISQSECIIHKDAIKMKDLQRITKYIDVNPIETDDKFCLNAICEGTDLITHKLKSKTRKILETITGRNIIECDTSEFEKSGGSVRCMVLDIYDPRMIKRKRNNTSAPASPK